MDTFAQVQQFLTFFLTFLQPLLTFGFVLVFTNFKGRNIKNKFFL